MLSSTHRSKAKKGNPKPLDPGPQPPCYESGLWTTLQTIKISLTGCLINNSLQWNFERNTVQIQVQAQELVISLYTCGCWYIFQTVKPLESIEIGFLPTQPFCSAHSPVGSQFEKSTSKQPIDTSSIAR